jgi:hypothetical protein
MEPSDEWEPGPEQSSGVVRPSPGPRERRTAEEPTDDRAPSPDAGTDAGAPVASPDAGLDPNATQPRDGAKPGAVVLELPDAFGPDVAYVQAAGEAIRALAASPDDVLQFQRVTNPTGACATISVRWSTAGSQAPATHKTYGCGLLIEMRADLEGEAITRAVLGVLSARVNLSSE